MASKLPKTFRGAEVVRGLGMNADAYDKLIEENSMDQFDATIESWLVVDDRGLEDSSFSEPKMFSNKKDAIRCAQAQANGNIDQRVLRVVEQILVVSTKNTDWA